MSGLVFAGRPHRASYRPSMPLQLWPTAYMHAGRRKRARRVPDSRNCGTKCGSPEFNRVCGGERKMFMGSPVPIRKVAVSFLDNDERQTVRSVAEMTELLLSSRWPKRANDALWKEALSCCLRSQQDHKKAKRARRAFVKAARGANIVVYSKH
ncbi:DUF982 domain-containing protein [Rhizobium cauense]|nr:DUF982 domain-containing protein [Rhizobium cauense]